VIKKLNDRYYYAPKDDFIGQGGFSTVYKAFDSLKQQPVALKFYKGSIDTKYDLEAEFQIARRLSHPNLIQMYDVVILEKDDIHGNKQKVQIGIFEYADQGDLKTFFNKHKLQLAPEHLGHLIMGILRGLQYIHQNQIIHRDLKPQNILLKQENDFIVPKITDFGISKALDRESTDSSQLLGSIEYMAPEQFNPKSYGKNQQLSTNLDLWSFGVIVTELMNGTPVFGKRATKTGVEQIMNRILKSPLPPPRVLRMKAPYDELLKKCLVRDATHRIASADPLIEILEPFLTGMPPSIALFETLPQKSVAVPPPPPTPYIPEEPPPPKPPEPSPSKTPAPVVIIRKKTEEPPAAVAEPKRKKIIISTIEKKPQAKKKGSDTPLIRALLVLVILFILGIIGFLLLRYFPDFYK